MKLILFSEIEEEDAVCESISIIPFKHSKDASMQWSVCFAYGHCLRIIRVEAVAAGDYRCSNELQIGSKETTPALGEEGSDLESPYQLNSCSFSPGGKSIVFGGEIPC